MALKVTYIIKLYVSITWKKPIQWDIKMSGCIRGEAVNQRAVKEGLTVSLPIF